MDLKLILVSKEAFKKQRSKLRILNLKDRSIKSENECIRMHFKEESVYRGRLKIRVISSKMHKFQSDLAIVSKVVR